jgi:hypothetical protein
VLEQLLDVAALPGELGLVVEVLILAAAAAGEERAARGGALGGGDEDLDEVGLGVVLVVAEDAHADLLAGKGEGDHEHPAGGGVVGQGHAGEAGTEVRERGDLDLEFVMIGEGTVVEGVFAGHGMTKDWNGGKTKRFFLSCVLRKSWFLSEHPP